MGGFEPYQRNVPYRYLYAAFVDFLSLELFT